MLDVDIVGLEILTVYIFCMNATNVNLAFNEFSKSIYDIRWYANLHVSQVYVLAILRDSQKTFEFSGLGVITCSLETVKKVNISFWSSN